MRSVADAEAAMDAVIDRAARAIRDAEDLLERDEAEREPLAEEDVERLRSFVSGPGRTPEWQAVIERIASGEVTWREVAEGVRDPGIDAAYASLRGVRPVEDVPAAVVDDDDEYFGDILRYRRG